MNCIRKRAAAAVLMLSLVLTACLAGGKFSLTWADETTTGTQTQESAEKQTEKQITISATKVRLIKKQSTTLKIKGTSSKVKWTSSNKAVATVTKSGKVTARKKGTTVIRASVNGKTLKCKVIVEEPSISRTSATILTGQTLQVSMKGTKQTVKWKTSRKNIAVVSENGLVTAKTAGIVKVRASIGGKKYYCVVKVEEPKLSSTSLKIKAGETGTISVYGTSFSVGWTSSNPSVAAVSSNGTIYAYRTGSATITATILDQTLSCTLIVKANPITSVSLSQHQMTLKIGRSANLSASISPSTTTDDKTITWSSSNSSVATVSYGTVTAVGSGTAVITAKAGTKYDTCTITVPAKSALEKNYDTLKSYVRSNGGSVSYAPNSAATWRITYNEGSDSLIFGYIYNGLGRNVSISMSANWTSVSYMNPQINYVYSTDKFTAVSAFAASVYSSSSSVSWNTISNETGTASVKVSSLSNQYLKNAFTNWSRLVRQAGLSMSKIGFTSY